MKKLVAKFNLEWCLSWCFGIGGLLVILLTMKQFDVAFLTNYSSILGIIGLGLIAIGAGLRLRQ